MKQSKLQRSATSAAATSTGRIRNENDRHQRISGLGFGIGEDVDELTTFIGNPSLNPPAIDTVLLLEKVLEPYEQKWIENLNLIEHLLVNVLENQFNLQSPAGVGSSSSSKQAQFIWKSQFVVRRFPTFIASCINSNEYAILAENINFTLNSPDSANGQGSSTNSSASNSIRQPFKQWKSKLNQNLGQTEIFYATENNSSNDISNVALSQSQLVIEGTNALCSNEFFKQFGTAFIEAFNQELAKINNIYGKEASTAEPTPKVPEINPLSSNKVQVLAPHLLAPINQNPTQINKIFKLAQTTIPIKGSSISKLSKCNLSINHLNSTITISLDETKVIIRPALFYCPIPAEHCSYQTKLNKLIIERLPLYHPLILQILQSLTKGYLLFPTNYDTIWNFGYWPAESHILSLYHASSVPNRLLKLFSAFCCQPELFLELVSPKRNLLFSEELEPQEDDDSEPEAEQTDTEINGHGHNSLESFKAKGQQRCFEQALTIDYFIQCFLNEFESYPNIGDWSPSSITKRLFHLLSITIDSIEKCFYPNYFTKTNLLKGFWKGSADAKNSTKSGTTTARQFQFGHSSIQDFIDDTGFGEGEESNDEETNYNKRHSAYVGEDDDDDRFTLNEIDLRHYAEIQEDDMPIKETEFDIKFEELIVNDDDDEIEVAKSKYPQPEQAEGVMAGSSNIVNPFSTFDDDQPRSVRTMSLAGETRQHGFGKLLRRISTLATSKPKRRHSAAVNGSDETELVRRSKSKVDHAIVGFEESINQMRREQNLQHHLPPATNSSIYLSGVTSTSSYVNVGFSPEQVLGAAPESMEDYHREQQQQPKESIYKIIIERLCSNELFYSIITPRSPDENNDTMNAAAKLEIEDEEENRCQAMMVHLETSRRILYSQDELITSWGKLTQELIRPKYICPHAFSSRQIQYIALLVNWIIKCTIPPSSTTTASTTWEISGDILRTVLYQMRSESNGTLLRKQKQKLGAQGSEGAGQENGKKKKTAFSFKSRSCNEDSNGHYSQNQNKKMSIVKKFSLYHQNSRSGSYDICKAHHHHLLDCPESSVVSDEFETTKFGMDNPELASTHRLLQWLWQLRNSKIGRLSMRANQYIEKLHETSLINSFFLEQWSSQNILQSLALKSAVAVTGILASASVAGNEKFPTAIPLVAAWKRGWLWSEMVLSLVSWNAEKGITLKAQIPILQVNEETGAEYVESYKIREIQQSPSNTTIAGPTITNPTSIISTATTSSLNSKQLHNVEPDDNAITLAFHSEIATPIGWNDFEDPRRPGPQTIPILIFSSTFYYNQWEVIGGNIIQVMTRLQKFNSLQQIGTLLAQPHKKTALNEIRKLNKSTAFKTFQFDGNVMTKTFRRLASLRNTRQKFFSTTAGRHRQKHGRVNFEGPQYLSCEKVGCNHDSQSANPADVIGTTKLMVHGRMEIECTKL